MNAAVLPWKRYGQHRLYVNDGDRRLGWGNVLTGEIVVEDDSAHDLVHQLVREHPHWAAAPRRELARTDEVIEAEIIEDDTTPVQPATPIEKPWRDLAANVAGEGVRKMAQQKEAEQRAEAGWLLSTFAKLADWKTEERNWRRGAEGEEIIGAELDKLRTHGWYVLHSVPVGTRGSDIDHVLIGPGGVFAVNTKRHLGAKVVVSGSKVWVNGSATHYVRNSTYEADRSSKLLSAAVGFVVPVRGVLVLTTGNGATIKNQPAEVWALEGTDVPKAFLRTGQVLTTEQIEAIFAMARRDTTWRSA